MKNIKIRPIYYDNIKEDIKLGRLLLLIQIVLIFLYGTLECIRFSMFNPNLPFLFIPLLLVGISIVFFRGYRHKSTIPFVNPLYSLMLFLFIVDTLIAINHIIDTGNNDRSLGEMTVLIISFFVAILTLVTYKKMIKIHKLLLPSYERYKSIINIRIRKNKRKRSFIRKLKKFKKYVY